MDGFDSINRLFVVIISIASMVMGFWVYFSDRRAKINKIFFLMTASFVGWIAFAYFSDLIKTPQLILISIKLSFASIAISFVSIYLFSIYFPVEEKKYLNTLDKVVILIGGLIFCLSAFSNFLIKDVYIENWGTGPVMSQLGGMIFYATIVLFAGLIIFNFLRKYFSLPLKEKMKVQYFLIGLSLATLFNLIFNVILPVFRGDIRYYQFGNYSLIFILGFTAFAIVKQKLFGIQVILTQALVGVIAILLLAQAITSETWFDRGWRFGLFLIFVYFGYLLIRSVIVEIQRRAELQRLYEEVDRLSRAKSEFISIASHQLRTPLTAIKGYISMLLEGSYGKFEEKSRSPLGKVYQSNERLISLVNDLLNISRIESGTLKLDLEKTSLDNMISSILDEIKIKADEKKLYLKWEKSPKPLPEITVDPGKIRQVILNIIDNCIKYTEKGGLIITTELKNPSAQWPQGKILIEIKDTGAGMTKEELEKMFESYSRGKAGASFWSAGLGLGLYIARKFTEIHGGRVWAKSEGPGKGSTFFIELPVK